LTRRLGSAYVAHDTTRFVMRTSDQSSGTRTPGNGNPNQVQAVGRAISILESLADGEEELGVTQIGRRLGVHKATASRLMATLAEHGLVERNTATDKYRLGFGLVRLASAAAGKLDLVQQSRPVLEQVAEESGETVNLAVLDGDEVVNIDQITPSHLVVNVNWVGKRTPLHCTSNGKVLLAFLPEAERKRFLSRRLRRMTDRTIVDPRALQRELEEVRARGWAHTVEELEVGLNAVAAPIRRAGGAVVAALSVSGPAYRVTQQRISELGPSVAAAAARISHRLGHVERGDPVG
jgi:DNA-binding IclR family transcriptional regulator